MSEHSGNRESIAERMFVPAPGLETVASRFSQRDSAPESRSTDPLPIPLHRPRPPAADIPRDHLGPFKAAVTAIEVITQAPAALGLQSVLATASLSTQALADVETLSGNAPLSLYCLSIAASGERKSTADKLALQAVRDDSEQRLADYE